MTDPLGEEPVEELQEPRGKDAPRSEMNSIFCVVEEEERSAATKRRKKKQPNNKERNTRPRQINNKGEGISKRQTTDQNKTKQRNKRQKKRKGKKLKEKQVE